MIFYSGILLIFLLLFGCSANEDLKPIDELIQQKKYLKALEQINKIESNSINDSLILKRINHRKVLATNGKLFSKMDSLFFKNDSSRIKSELKLIHDFIKTNDTLIARWYYFDYFRNKGQLFLMKPDTMSWLTNIKKAVEFPSSNEEMKNSLFIDIAFYYAGKKKFIAAREWLDKAMGRLNINEKETELVKVYSHYMNGKFHLADSHLNRIKYLDKKSHWQKVQHFLNLYSDSLTMENRFRLW